MQVKRWSTCIHIDLPGATSKEVWVAGMSTTVWRGTGGHQSDCHTSRKSEKEKEILRITQMGHK